LVAGRRRPRATTGARIGLTALEDISINEYRISSFSTSPRDIEEAALLTRVQDVV
jgi:hypothetical protein